MDLKSISANEFDALAREHLQQIVLGRRRFMIGTGAAIGALSLLPSVAFAEGGQGVLTVGRSQEPDNLDPHKTSLTVSEETIILINEPLVRFDVDGNLIPALAESWEFTEENKVLTFKLKPNATFTDGSPIDAEAVAWTVNRHISEEMGSPTAFILGPIEAVEVIDPLTVAYRFSEPFIPVWAGLTSAYCVPLSKKTVEELGDRFGREVTASGPFMLKSWSPDQGLRLERNPDYATIGAPTSLEAIEFRYYPEDASRIAAFETGELNAVLGGVPLDSVNRLKANPDYQLLEKPSQGLRALVFNQSKAPFDNANVRRAICHAIDNNKLIAFAMNGLAAPAKSPVASSIPGFSEVAAKAELAYDPELAKSILAEEGYADGLTLTLNCNDTDAIRRSAEVIQSQLGEIGVSVQIQALPIAQWAALAKQGEQNMAIASYTYNEMDIVYPMLHKEGALNYAFHTDTEMDGWIEEQRKVADPAARQAIQDKIQTRVVADAYWKPLFEPLSFALLASNIKGARMYPWGGIRPDEVSIEG